MSHFDAILKFGDRMRARIEGAIDDPIGDSEFEELAGRLFSLQAEALPMLKTLAARRGLDLAGCGPWSRLPAIPTAMFKELDLSGIPVERRCHHFLSSGTTAEARSRHWHCLESLALYEASLMTWFNASVSVGSHAFVSLTPEVARVPNSSLVHMFDRIAAAMASGPVAFFGKTAANGAWEVRFEDLFARLVGLDRPVLLVGTAFSFVHMLDEMKSRGLKLALPAGSMLLETGGYKGRSRALPKAELHRRMRIRFGVPEEAIICEYGMSELSSQAYDTGRSFRFPSWARAVIVSPETGEEVEVGGTGLLRIVDLANTFSVMSVQTEDLAVRTKDGFEMLGRLAEAEPRGCSLMAA